MQSEAYIRYARLLIDIARRSDNIAELQRQYNDAIRNNGTNAPVYTNGEPVLPVLGNVDTSDTIMDEIIYQLNTCIKLIENMYADLLRIDEAIPGSQFNKDFQILDNYTATFERNLANCTDFRNRQNTPQY